jgi:hypothetical protein
MTGSPGSVVAIKIPLQCSFLARLYLTRNEPLAGPSPHFPLCHCHNWPLSNHLWESASYGIDLPLARHLDCIGGSKTK